ncbi:hypothetical protein CCH79_00014997, partial [Gambusia affinis]
MVTLEELQRSEVQEGESDVDGLMIHLLDTVLSRDGSSFPVSFLSLSLTLSPHPAGFLIGARPENACEPIEPPPRENLTGAFIVLIKRYDCNFDMKVPNLDLLVYVKSSLMKRRQHDSHTRDLFPQKLQGNKGIIDPILTEKSHLSVWVFSPGVSPTPHSNKLTLKANLSGKRTREYTFRNNPRL